MKKYGPRKTEPLKRILHSTFVQKYFMKDFANHNTRNKGKKILEKGLTMNCNTLNQPTPSVAVYSSPLSFLLKTVEHLLFEKVCFFFFILKGILAMPLMPTNNLSFVRVLVKRKCNFYRYLTCLVLWLLW